MINYLNILRVSNFAAERMEVLVAFSKVYKLFIKLSREVPPSHRGDVHRIELLRNALIGYRWTHGPLSRVATHRLFFQQLFVELEAARLCDKDAKLVTLRDKAIQSHRLDQHGKSFTGYVGQVRYGRPGHYDVSHQSKRTSPPDIAGCFNCSSPSHMMKQ